MVDGLRSLQEGYVPPIFSDLGGAELFDRKTIVSPRASVEWTRRLPAAGVFASLSSGAAMAGAAKCAQAISPGVIVVVCADGGWKYLSAGAWTDDIDLVTERARRTIRF
jgi:cysteine synthase B